MPPQNLQIPQHNNLYLSTSSAPLTTPLISHPSIPVHPLSSGPSKMPHGVIQSSKRVLSTLKQPHSKSGNNSTLPMITAVQRKQPPVVIGRPGGGGESDAAFTPSPPVVGGSNGGSHEVALGLVHQNRIRNLYSQSEVIILQTELVF